MTTAVNKTEKMLVYDGDCPMCTSTVAFMLRAKLLRPEQARANYDLSPAELESARAAGIRNQLVVFDPETGETRSGADALRWIVADNTNNHVLVRVWGLPGFRNLLRWGYENISYNRRIISPPRQRIVCDCEPDVTLARRLSLAIPLVAIAAGLAAAFGAALFHRWSFGDPLSGAILMEVATGSGWLALALATFVSLRSPERVDYLAHLAVTMFVGAIVLVPGGLLALFLSPTAALAIGGLSALASFALMFLMQGRRVKAVGISGRWLWGWVVAVPLGFALAVYIYDHFWRALG